MAVKHHIYECAFQPFVQNREQIKVTLAISTEYRETWGHPYDEDCAHWLRTKVNIHSESAVNQWALRFKHADEALTSSAYRSLADTVRQINVPCTVTQVLVQNIIPLTPPVEVKAVPVPKRMGQRMREELEETQEAIQVLNECSRRSNLAAAGDVEIIEEIIQQYKRRIKGRGFGFL